MAVPMPCVAPAHTSTRQARGQRRSAQARSMRRGHACAQGCHAPVTTAVRPASGRAPASAMALTLLGKEARARLTQAEVRR